MISCFKWYQPNILDIFNLIKYLQRTSKLSKNIKLHHIYYLKDKIDKTVEHKKPIINIKAIHIMQLLLIEVYPQLIIKKIMFRIIW